MTDYQLDLCRRGARIAARAYHLEFNECLSEAVLAALEHPQWWTHTPSWIIEAVKSYVYVALVRKERRRVAAEQGYFEGAVPAGVTAARERVRRRGNVCQDQTHTWDHTARRCKTCAQGHQARYLARKKAALAAARLQRGAA